MWNGNPFWRWTLQLLAWCAVYFVISPLPLAVGGIALYPYAAETISSVLLYSLLMNVFIFYSYQFYWFPRYLETASIRAYWGVNLSYLLGIALIKSVLDYGFTTWILAFSEGGEIILGLDMQSQQLPDGEEPYSFLTWFFLNLISTTVILLVVNAYSFIRDWWQNRRARQQLENEKLRMELAALKNQINPHFLFNILNGLYALALKNEDEPTANGIEKLSGMMRYVLYESNDTFVSLTKEIEYIQNYIELQKLRVNRQVSIILEIEGKVKEQLVAPMLFIPFIENAFKYGISAAKASEIVILISLEESQLQFQVENPIHHTTNSDHIGYQGIGLENVKKRLQLLYPNRHQISIDTTNQRFVVCLSLDL
ncbi:MAG: histidine kinase [Bacteroidota bacterium]